MRTLYILFLLNIIMCGYKIGFTAAQQEPLMIPKLNISARIDGKLDEACWQQARKLELKYETDPGENTQAPVRTEGFMFYNRHNIYLAFICHDPNPKAIRARYSSRDGFDSDDMITINLDTFNDERRNYFFGCNALGEQRDGTATSDNESLSWDAIWNSSARITEQGYIVEIAIPFSALGFPRTKGPQVWGLDITRRYPRGYSHRLGLVKIDRNNNSYQGQFQKIIGFENVAPGKSIEIIPTITGIRSDQRSSLPDGKFEKVSRDFEPGLTAQWGITNNLTVNGTINPDFSQVEADSPQLDINQPFALYFREKRSFFTEGADYFDTPLNILHTRTLRDPQWGLKLSGKEGGNTVGFYLVRDSLTNLIFPGNQGSDSTSSVMDSTATVFRYKRDIGSNYTLGAIFTNRGGDDYFNRVYGVDGEARFNSRNRLHFQFLGTSTRYDETTAQQFQQPTGTFSGRAIHLSYSYDSRNFSMNGYFRDIDKKFRADLGFVPKVDYRLYGGSAFYWWDKKESWWSRFRVGVEYEYAKDSDGDFLEDEGEFNINVSGILQSHLHLDAEKLRRTYNGVTYELSNGSADFRFQPMQNLLLFSGVGGGSQIDYANSRKGKVLRMYGGLVFNMGQNLNLEGKHTYEKLKVKGEDLYTANISRVSLTYHFNVRMFFKGIVQYVDYRYNVGNYTISVEPIYRDLFSQLLFSYRLNPRTVAFLGYSGGYLGSQQFPLTQANRTFFLKVSYSWQM